MKKYFTIVYLPEDEENANALVDILENMRVEVHAFEKTEDKNPEIIRDIKNTACLVLFNISDEFDYRDYLKEIKTAHKRCQTVCVYSSKKTYQKKYSLNEIEIQDEYPIEALAGDICSIAVGGFKLRVTSMNRAKYRKEAIVLFNKEEYVWSLCLLLKVFKINDMEVKEKIGNAFARLMNSDKAINYYSICLPIKDDDSKGTICNNLGYLYTQTNNLEFAERYLKQAIHLENPDALYNLGYLYETTWAYDSSKRRVREAYAIYCDVLQKSYTSDRTKALARERLKMQADKLLLRKNYAPAMTYYKAIGDGAKVAECIRNIKRIRQLYEARKKKSEQK